MRGNINPIDYNGGATSSSTIALTRSKKAKTIGGFVGGTPRTTSTGSNPGKCTLVGTRAGFLTRAGFAIDHPCVRGDVARIYA
jgi:hypothetical protein